MPGRCQEAIAVPRSPRVSVSLPEEEFVAERLDRLAELELANQELSRSLETARHDLSMIRRALLDEQAAAARLREMLAAVVAAQRNALHRRDGWLGAAVVGVLLAASLLSQAAQH